MNQQWAICRFKNLAMVGLLLIVFGMQMGNSAWSQSQNPSFLLRIPGAVFGAQINSQQQALRQSNYTIPETHGIRDDIIFTDRFKRPISQQEFMYEVQRHHAEIYNNSHADADSQKLAPFIEPPPPQDASFH